MSVFSRGYFLVKYEDRNTRVIHDVEVVSGTDESRSLSSFLKKSRIPYHSTWITTEQVTRRRKRSTYTRTRIFPGLPFESDIHVSPNSILLMGKSVRPRTTIGHELAIIARLCHRLSEEKKLIEKRYLEESEDKSLVRQTDLSSLLQGRIYQETCTRKILVMNADDMMDVFKLQWFDLSDHMYYLQSYSAKKFSFIRYSSSDLQGWCDHFANHPTNMVHETLPMKTDENRNTLMIMDIRTMIQFRKLIEYCRRYIKWSDRMKKLHPKRIHKLLLTTKDLPRRQEYVVLNVYRMQTKELYLLSLESNEVIVDSDVILSEDLVVALSICEASILKRVHGDITIFEEFSEKSGNAGNSDSDSVRRSTNFIPSRTNNTRSLSSTISNAIRA